MTDFNIKIQLKSIFTECEIIIIISTSIMRTFLIVFALVKNTVFVFCLHLIGRVPLKFTLGPET